MKNDKSERLLDAVGMIGDDLVNEAAKFDAKRERKKKITRVAAAAASFALVAAAALTVAFKMNKDGNNERTVFPADPIVFDDPDASHGADHASLPEELRAVKITSSAGDGKIIGTDDYFIVEAGAKCDEETVARYMNVSPGTNVSLTRLSETSFKACPASGALAPGTLYKISFGDKSNPAACFAFQTESEFFVKDALPRAMALGVPVNTGIEFTLSEAANADGLEDCVSIEPSVGFDCILYPNGKTISVVPKKDLKYNTVYKVTLKGVRSLSGRELKEEYSVSFKTVSNVTKGDGRIMYVDVKRGLSAAERENYRYDYSLYELIFSPDEEINLDYSIYNWTGYIKNVKAAATLYKFGSVDEAREAMLKSATKDGRDERTFDTDGLEKTGEFTGEPMADSEWRGRITIGTGLEKGVYLAVIGAEATDKFGDAVAVSRVVVIEVTDLRVFTIGSDGKTLIRVDDRKSGRAEGAQVSSVSFSRVYDFEGKLIDPSITEDSSVTKDGVCVIENGGGTSSLITVRYNDDSAIICANVASKDESAYVMSSIYTDREMYFSNDVINFSGFAVRLDGVRSKALFIKTSDSQTEELTFDKNGYFSGSVRIENHSAGGLFLSVVDEDGNSVASKYVRITEEEKPTITASLSFDKLFYRHGETANVTLKATFFDGTPAEKFEFFVDCDPFAIDEGGRFTTDENGEATFTVQTGYINDPGSTHPSRICVTAELTSYETQKLCVSADAVYFHSDYVFGTVWDNGRRALTLNHLDTSKLLSADDLEYPAFPDNTVGGPADGYVDWSLIKYEIVKTEHTGYDYEEKRSYKYYTSETKESVVDGGSYSFEDGVIELPMKKVEGFTGGYFYSVGYYDGRYHYTTRISATQNRYVYYHGANDIEVTLDREYYKPGDTVTAEFTMNGVPYDDVLFAAFADGLEGYGSGRNFSIVYDGAMIAGAEIYAVTFDGETGKYSWESARVKLDTSGAALDIVITPDKDVYEPGEDATVKIKVKDGGGAALTLSVVDEACFAMMEQNANSLGEFFTSAKRLSKFREGYVPYYYYYPDYGYNKEYSSGPMKGVAVNQRFSVSELVRSEETNYESGGSANNADGEVPTEAGDAFVDKTITNAQRDEKDVRVRENFADNPVFLVAELDANGEATVKFKVPDNVTSWRITATAATGFDGGYDKIRLGNAVTDVICTKDFFINLSAPEYYIEGDDAAFLARSFGKASAGKVEYSAVLTDDGGAECGRAAAADDSKGYAEMNFGKLGAGHYKATVYGYGDDSTDALSFEFDVIASAEIMRDKRTVTPDEIGSITPALYPVTLSFYDADASHGLLNSIIYDLIWQDSARSDRLAAKYTAYAALSRLFGIDDDGKCDMIKNDFKDYGYSLFTLLKYSEGDTELTAQILTIAPELADSDRRRAIANELENYIGKGKYTDETSLCASLAALAALNEPILDTLYSFSNVAGSFPSDAKLYLASAFASLGDWNAASAIYRQIKSGIAVQNDEYGTLKFAGASDDETIRLSTLALLVASRCEKGDAELIAKYLFENRSKTEFNTVGLASFVKYFLPDGDFVKKELTYELNGETLTQEINPWGVFTLKLSKSALGSFRVISSDGVGIDASYFAAASEVLERSDVSDRVTVSKTIEPYEKGLYKVSLTVSGTSTRVCESFDLTDAVPSGARFFASYGSNSYNESGGVHTSAHVFNPSAQKVKGQVWVYNSIYSGKDVYKTECPEYSFSVTISYVIRGAVKGEFVSEPAILSNLGANVYSASERYLVTIADGEWKITEKQ